MHFCMSLATSWTKKISRKFITTHGTIIHAILEQIYRPPYFHDMWYQFLQNVKGYWLIYFLGNIVQKVQIVESINKQKKKLCIYLADNQYNIEYTIPHNLMDISTNIHSKYVVMYYVST